MTDNIIINRKVIEQLLKVAETVAYREGYEEINATRTALATAEKAEDAKDAARYRKALIACRGSVKSDLNRYEAALLNYAKSSQEYKFMDEEAQRLHGLLADIDAAMKGEKG